MTPVSADRDNVKGWKRLIYTEASDDRGNMRRVLNSLVLHLHPVRVPARAIRFTYTWGLGGISTLLCLLLAITGVLLMFRYEPDVERAYLSIQALEAEVAFGSLIRGVHHWSANLLVITAFLHLLRVFLTGGFKAGRTTNWIIGVVLLVVVLAFNFTGYLLPWDQLSYWAVTVSTADHALCAGAGHRGRQRAPRGPRGGRGNAAQLLCAPRRGAPSRHAGAPGLSLLAYPQGRRDLPAVSPS